MSFDRHNWLLGKMKRTFDLLRSPSEIRHDGRRIAPVMKLNIAPLMGRRDAAVDRASAFLDSDIFSLRDDNRINLYDHISRLLEHALEDCELIISGLTSSDTINREKRLRSFISILYATMITIKDVAALENIILVNRPDVLKEFEVNESGSRLAESEKVMTGTEINLVNRLRDYFDRTQPRLVRYREYAKKSFSPVYAEKYTTAYRSYFKVFEQNECQYVE